MHFFKLNLIVIFNNFKYMFKVSWGLLAIKNNTYIKYYNLYIKNLTNKIIFMRSYFYYY